MSNKASLILAVLAGSAIVLAGTMFVSVPQTGDTSRQAMSGPGTVRPPAEGTPSALPATKEPAARSRAREQTQQTASLAPQEPPQTASAKAAPTRSTPPQRTTRRNLQPDDRSAKTHKDGPAAAMPATKTRGDRATGHSDTSRGQKAQGGAAASANKTSLHRASPAKTATKDAAVGPGRRDAARQANTGTSHTATAAPPRARSSVRQPHEKRTATARGPRRPPYAPAPSRGSQAETSASRRLDSATLSPSSARYLKRRGQGRRYYARSWHARNIRRYFRRHEHLAHTHRRPASRYLITAY